MIAQLTGRLAEKLPLRVLIDVAGVGYEVHVPMSTFEKLPEAGHNVVLLTQFVVREDAQLLYGFLTAAERDSFRSLTKISGVGPRTALSILSGLSVVDLAAAVAQQDIARLTKVPGIGSKTAQRLLLELKGQLQAPAGVVAPSGSAGAHHQDIVQALLALGYSEKEAQASLKKLPAHIDDVSEGIRLVLKSLHGR